MRTALFGRGFLGTAALVVTLLATAAPVAAEETDPDHATLDRYEAIATEMNRRANARLTELRADMQSLGDRIASDNVGKPYFDNPNAMCRQKACWGAMSGNGELSFDSCEPPLEPGEYSRAQFDEWFEVNRAAMGQAEAELDQGFRNVQDLIAEKRQELDNADADPAHQGDAWIAARHADIMRGFTIADYLKYSYLNIIDVHLTLINVALIDIGGGTTTFGPPPPPGIDCLLLSELSIEEAADQRPAQLFNIQASAASKAEQNADAERLFGQMKAALQQCAVGEERRRDVAASRLRELRDRYFEEREGIRQRMLRWRQEAIDAGLYVGSGDAAVAEIYGTPVDLSADNVFGYHLPHVLGLPYSGNSNGLLPEVWSKQTAASWPLIQLEDICVANGDAPPAVKYADLEPEGPFTLEITNMTEPILDGIASGADDMEGP